MSKRVPRKTDNQNQRSFPLRRKRSRHKSLDFDDLIIVADNIDNWTRRDSEGVLRNAVSQMGEIYLERIKANTPIRDIASIRYPDGYDPPYSRPSVDGGEGFMRENWQLTSVIPLSNKRYQVTVKNDARFAEAVEYGHKQDVGAYVTQIHNHLKESTVEGIHTIRRTKEELAESKEMERTLQKKFDAELERIFNGK